MYGSRAGAAYFQTRDEHAVTPKKILRCQHVAAAGPECRAGRLRHFRAAHQMHDRALLLDPAVERRLRDTRRRAASCACGRTPPGTAPACPYPRTPLAAVSRDRG